MRRFDHDSRSSSGEWVDSSHIIIYIMGGQWWLVNFDPHCSGEMSISPEFRLGDIYFLRAPAGSCSLESLLLCRSFIMFFYCWHTYFGNFYSTVPVDVLRVTKGLFIASTSQTRNRKIIKISFSNYGLPFYKSHEAPEQQLWILLDRSVLAQKNPFPFSTKWKLYLHTAPLDLHKLCQPADGTE